MWTPIIHIRHMEGTIDPLAFTILMGLLVLGLAGIAYLYLKSGGLYEHLDR